MTVYGGGGLGFPKLGFPSPFCRHLMRVCTVLGSVSSIFKSTVSKNDLSFPAAAVSVFLWSHLLLMERRSFGRWPVSETTNAAEGGGTRRRTVLLQVLIKTLRHAVYYSSDDLRTASFFFWQSCIATIMYSTVTILHCSGCLVHV